MAIPSFDAQGFLPPGIHDCTLEEIRERFGAFEQSDRRLRLLARLEVFLAELQSVRSAQSVVVNGSLVMAEPQRNDINLVLVLAPGRDFAADLSPSECDVLSRRRVQRRHGFDLLVACADSDQYQRSVRLFEQIRVAPGRTKGILRISL